MQAHCRKLSETQEETVSFIHWLFCFGVIHLQMSQNTQISIYITVTLHVGRHPMHFGVWTQCDLGVYFVLKTR